MKMDMVVEVLNAHGIKAELSTANKAGINVPCIRFGEGRVTPTVYEQTWDSFSTEEEVLDFAKKVLNNTPAINIDGFYTKEYVLDNVISCIRHETNDEQAVKFTTVYEDLEEYFRVPVKVNNDFNGSVVVIKEHLKGLGIEAEELRVAAREHLKEHATIDSMKNVLTELIGESIDELPDMGEDFMYVATTDTKSYGASVMLLEDVLADFCLEKGLKSLIIIPSSISEIILIADEQDEAMINDMICDVNATQFTDNSTDILSNHLYRFVA